MSLTDEEILELHELLDDLVENNLAGKRLRRLEEWLSESEAARRRYVRFMDLSSSLRHYAEECFAEEDEDSEIASFNKEGEGLLRFFRPLAAIAAVLALAFVVIQSLQRPHGENVDLPVKTAQLPPGSTVALPLADAVGQLTKASGVEWMSDSELRPNRGDSLPAGALKLETGLAQIELLNGATVVLEGPADCRLLSPSKMFLAKGKLRAIVPPAAAGFSVDMSKGKVIDLGTEFGLHVFEDGSAEIYVFDGKVLFERNDHDAELAFRELNAGESIFVDESGEIASIDMPSEPFFGAADVAHRSMEEAQRRYTEWVTLSDELAEDSRTSLYFTFDDHREWDRALRDDAHRKEKLEDGAIVGCKWIEGRWPGKGALRFSGPNDRVRIKLATRPRALTLAAWVRLDRKRTDFNPIVHLPSKVEGALSWGIDGRGRMRLRVHQNPEPAVYTSSIILHSNQIGRWVHLATTYDPKQGKVMHYLDGLFKGSENLRGNPRLSLDGGELGNLGSDAKIPPDGSNLRGAIDEFVVFRQALPAEEIRRIYEIGRPFSLPRLDRLP